MSDLTPVSVVIPTYNRSGLLRRTLLALEAQSLPRSSFEVVVADDGSNDDTRTVVAEFSARGPLTYVFQPDEGYRVAAARNAGARAATGDVLVFLDTGTLAGPDFVAAHLAAVRAAERTQPRNAVVGYAYGYNPWGPSGELPKLVDELSPAQIVDRLRADDGFRDVRHEVFAGVADDLDRVHVPWMLFWTMNVSMRAATFWSVGGFDEDFQGWGCEDLELGYRLTDDGVRLVVSRAAWAIEVPHDRDLSGNSASNAANAFRLWSKHPVPVMELYWGIHGNGSYEPLEERYGDFLRWRDATAHIQVTEEVRAAVGPGGVGRVLVLGADRSFVPPVGAADWAALCPDDAPVADAPNLVTHQAIGLRTTYPDDAFDVVVVTSRLAGLWPRWGEILLREARRVGARVVLTPRLREAVSLAA